MGERLSDDLRREKSSVVSKKEPIEIKILVTTMTTDDILYSPVKAQLVVCDRHHNRIRF